MKIVDSQIHIWNQGKPIGNHKQMPSYTAEDALRDMAAAGVDAAVLHPPAWDPNTNQIALDAARRYPDKFSVLGFFDVKNTPDIPAVLAHWREQPGQLGLRFGFLAPGQEDWLEDGTMERLWGPAQDAGLPVALLVPGKVPVVGDIARRFPKLRLLVDHMGVRRRVLDEPAFGDFDKLLELAQYPNVAVKVSGLSGYSSQPYPSANVHPYLKRVYEKFGAERMFWGTDITRLDISWRQAVTMFTEELPWLKGGDLELVMGKGLCQWIGWKL